MSNQTTEIDSIDLLVTVYEDYITKHGLPPVSADEQDITEIVEEQLEWMKAFQVLWDEAQSR